MKTILIFCSLICLSSCISKSKYVQLLDNRNRTEEARIRLEQELAGSKAALDNMRTTNSNQNELQAQFDKISKQNATLLQEKTTLENRIKTLQAENTSMKAKAQAKSSDAKFDGDEAQWEQLAMAIDRQKKTYQQLRSEITNNFSADIANGQLGLQEKEAGLVITLSQDLLFSKGSDLIQPTGISMLAKLTPLIRNATGAKTVVLGHTDNDGDVGYNWSLSTRRATAVVQLLMDNGLSGDRITASGRALFDPIAANDTSENKAKNRRIEIIVYDNLERILNILN